MAQPTLLEHSIYDAARLRGLAYFNNYDVNQTVRHGRPIRYFVDPAVALLLFVWPGRLYDTERHNASYLSTFSHVSLAPEAQVVDGLLSGECLFLQDIENAKSGGNGSRFTQREMLPSHWTEFARVLNSFLTREVGDDPKLLTKEFRDAINEAHRDLEQVNVELSKGTLEGSPDIETRCALMSAAATRLERTKIMQIAMQRRIRQLSLVLPATKIPQSVFQPNNDEIEKWSDALIDAGKVEGIRPDAKVLAQLDMLNAEEAKKPSKERILNVLVTGDHAIHKAFYARRLAAAVEKQRGGEFIGERFVPDWEREEFSRFMATYTLRHPAQFVATLNQQQMRNKIDTRQLFEKVVTGTEAILASVTGSEAEAINLAAMAVRDAREAMAAISDCIKQASHLDLDQIAEDFGDVKQIWDDSMQRSILINRGAIIKRMRAARKVAEEVQLGDGALERFLEKEQLSLWNSVTTIGLSNAAREALGQMRTALVNRRIASRGAETRMPAHLIFDYGPIIGEQKLFSVQEDLENGDRAVFDTLDRRIMDLEPQQIWRALLLSAVFAARASDWSRLIWYAGKTLEALAANEKTSDGPRETEGYFETLYAAAIGRRMRHFETDYDEANAYLSEAIAHHDRSSPEDPVEQLRLARALSERGTLRLFEQFRQLKSARPSALLPADEITEARQNLMRATGIAQVQYQSLFPGKAIEAFPARTQNQIRRLCAHVWRQSTLNLPFFDLLGHFVFPADAAFPDHYETSEFRTMVEDAEKAWRQLEDQSVQNRATGAAEEALDAIEIVGEPGELDDEGEDNAPINSPHIRLDISILCAADSFENIDKLRELRSDIMKHYAALPKSQTTADDRLLAQELYRWVLDWLADRLESSGEN